jgi:hypothetical protein
VLATVVAESVALAVAVTEAEKRGEADAIEDADVVIDEDVLALALGAADGVGRKAHDGVMPPAHSQLPSRALLYSVVDGPEKRAPQLKL